MGITRRTTIRVLLAFSAITRLNDSKLFVWLLPRGMKRRYPPLDPITRASFNVLEYLATYPGPLPDEWFCGAPLLGYLAKHGPSSGGTYIQEPIIYG